MKPYKKNHIDLLIEDSLDPVKRNKMLFYVKSPLYSAILVKPADKILQFRVSNITTYIIPNFPTERTLLSVLLYRENKPKREKTPKTPSDFGGERGSDVIKLVPPLQGYGREINKIYDVLFKSYLPAV
ncbi:hypothetical protein JTB14_000770 [Gonioctena quinquepunctata]|nr:hypothetical protein JTB14_000770 [Gonioctena quinquepunctata]